MSAAIIALPGAATEPPPRMQRWRGPYPASVVAPHTIRALRDRRAQCQAEAAAQADQARTDDPITYLELRLRFALSLCTDLKAEIAVLRQAHPTSA